MILPSTAFLSGPAPKGLPDPLWDREREDAAVASRRHEAWRSHTASEHDRGQRSGLFLFSAGGSLSESAEEVLVTPLWAYLLSAALVVAILYYFFRVLRASTAYES
ncbi:hypothetical protein [Neolewinella litorea]|uniref:Uncharacterized protein n=1 Tax=Neolewinella litorea TaxID=2562452 RepID=A0A4V3XL28_9BACT|nr:hypothetical protein [Neolewinella litorea]THH39263.1 hypothetical protein E4021_10925 [Neolewinella litorea]